MNTTVIDHVVRKRIEHTCMIQNVFVSGICLQERQQVARDHVAFTHGQQRFLCIFKISTKESINIFQAICIEYVTSRVRPAFLTGGRCECNALTVSKSFS